MNARRVFTNQKTCWPCILGRVRTSQLRRHNIAPWLFTNMIASMTFSLSTGQRLEYDVIPVPANDYNYLPTLCTADSGIILSITCCFTYFRPPTDGCIFLFLFCAAVRQGHADSHQSLLHMEYNIVLDFDSYYTFS